MSDPALERRLDELERELRELRALVQGDVASQAPPAAPATRKASAAPEAAPPAVPRLCHACGSVLVTGARFCVECGAQLEAARPAHAPPPAPPPRVAVPPPPPPPRPPRKPLRELVPPISTTMVLAWMGGVIAVLGLTFLFVYAARRGWFVPPLRLAVGGAVSGGLLGFAVWFHHRRNGRYEAVLASAGAGIAGLYTTLFAAAEMYHYLGRPSALACAGAIALVATVVALDLSAEPLAVFGVCAAVLAPLLVARDVTALGLAFGALIGVTGLVCLIRRRWVWLTVGVLVVGLPQVLWIAAATDPGFGLWVLGPLLFAGLWAASMYVHALRPPAPRRLDELTGALASAAAASLVATALQSGRGSELLGGGVDGWLVLGVSAVLMVGAFVPWLARRAHPDLADLLGAYSLTALALAIGLLLDGSGRACGWAAEAGLLALVALRVRARTGADPVGRRRATRMYAGASAYLVPAVAAALAAAPPREASSIADWGSHHGLVGLAGLAAGAAVWAAVAVRTTGWPTWRRWATVLPFAVLAYAAPFAVAGRWVVVAWAAGVGVLAAALAERHARRELGAFEIFAPAFAVLLLAAGVTAHAFAPLDEALSIADWGSHHGLLPLAAVALAAAALAAAALRTSLPVLRWTTAAPVVAVVYATPFVLDGDAVLFAWIGIAAVVAAPLYVPRARALLGELELLAESAATLALAAGVAAYHDHLVRQLAYHGERHGILVAACLTAVAFELAFAVADRRHRALALRVPLALVCVTLATVLPGAWAVAGWAATAGLLALVIHLAPDRVARVADLQLTLESAAWLTVIAAVVSVTVYETPARLFHANPDPATGIAALAAATAAAWLVALAARTTGITLRPFDLSPGRLAVGAAVLSLWTVTAALLGIGELQPRGAGDSQVERHFQQGQVAVSVTWGLVGLLVLYLGFRRPSRALRSAGVVLLFVTPLKLVGYDLAFLPTTARAASFIVTGLVLLGAAFLMQRLGGPPADRGGPASGPPVAPSAV